MINQSGLRFAFFMHYFQELFPAFRCNLFFKKGFPLQSGLRFLSVVTILHYEIRTF
jgi:hypothetical protein